MNASRIAPTLLLALLAAGCGDTKRELAQENDLNTDEAAVTVPREVEEYVEPSGDPGLDPTGPDTGRQITATMALLERGVGRIEPGQALRTIEEWQAKLRSQNDPALKGISEDLERLQDAISAGNLAPATVGPLLVRLGEQTVAAAPQADPGLQAPLARLGRVLGMAGNQLSPGT